MIQECICKSPINIHPCDIIFCRAQYVNQPIKFPVPVSLPPIHNIQNTPAGAGVKLIRPEWLSEEMKIQLLIYT